jgi:RimJ/RimL family protein N-acetyltransferase
VKPVRLPVRVEAGPLVLRVFTAGDIPALARAFADPEVLRWNPGPVGDDTTAAVRAWLEERNDWSNGFHASWAIADRAGALLGSVSLHKIDIEQADAEVGYWVAPWGRRRGVASAAVIAAAQFGFGGLGLHRLHLFHAVENTASCRVAAAAGFRLEGQLRKSYRFADGAYHDEHLHARLSSDRPGLREPGGC